ncbi:phosphoribosyltransferase family protein [Erysipelothrix rhusiopathiae]|nr:phosphoribosyltransferase family protein [Erysipelothrix rhusiopathiae]MDE8203181.1 phosphoribosyltransferase family protein [Erysipelothrix rhusiopathiae]MDE8300945.1 phosphoribosyltransferase family protein [Erysipelothrix rhusiopathiae]MDE8306034.1 phosphoribosyltransferase family protein [Erysipelothrix rhusiopathiae]MDE8340050.1 phosphoribosyltransferase family protein [Erysipelothrix rhusiopathiae]
MKLLEEIIQEKGKVKSEEIVDVSSFLNAQVDPKVMEALGKDFADFYADYDFDLFVTVETSGIAPSVFAALYANKPLIIIKKSLTEKDDPKFIQQSCFSFTKKNGYHLTVPKHLIEGKRVILLDDFLAKGSVVHNVDKLLTQANASLVATGICISKNFQPGYQMLVNEGHDLYCQAQIESIDVDSGIITFKS